MDEESFKRVAVIVVFAVEDGPFVWVHSDRVEHADEEHSTELLDEAHARLNGIVIVSEGGKEGSFDASET